MDNDARSITLRPIEVVILEDGTMDRVNAARYLGISPRTLATWATCRFGPPYIRVGRKCYYRRTALDAWKAERETARETDR